MPIVKLGMMRSDIDAQASIDHVLAYRSHTMFGRDARRRDVGVFINNRCLITAVAARINDTLLGTVGQEVIDIYKEYSTSGRMREYTEDDLKQRGLIRDLLMSASLLIKGNLPIHDFQSLSDLQYNLENMDNIELREIVDDGLCATPLLNIVDILFQTGDEGLTAIGLQYLNICNVITKRLDLIGPKARVNSLYGAYFLDNGDAAPAEQLLTDMSEVPNQYDYTKFLNQVLLSMSKKRQNDPATAARVDQRASHIKEVMNISDHAEEIGWLIFPKNMLTDDSS